MADEEDKQNLHFEAIKDYIKTNPDKAAEMIAEDMKNLYGFKITNKEAEKETKDLKSFVPPDEIDGALITGYSAYNQYYVDFGAQKVNDEIRMIERYREMAISPEAETAIDDIINEMIAIDEDKYPINIVLDNCNIDTSLKKKIRKEFEYILDLYNFKQIGYEIIRKWYVDGRIYYHLMVDTKEPKKGILEVRYIDPRKIRKIKEAPEEDKNEQKSNAPVKLYKKYNEFFVYSEQGFDMISFASSSSTQFNGLKISPDSVAYTHSGIMDNRTGMILSHLHKAIKPYNQVRMMEDATVIYRIVRAPERRIFYIDIGGLTPQVAERYVATVADRFKNKLSYDVGTGEMTNDRRFMTMLEDYFLAQREGKGTSVETLAGGQNLGQMEDVEYFRRKLYKALNVPISRLESDGAFNLGRPQEISRDEVKFSKFIKRLRANFVLLFEQTLQKQLALKGIVSENDWDKIRQHVFYDFKEDSHFSELRDAEILANRLGILQQVHTYTTIEGGGYFSRNWVKKFVLKQTEKEIQEIEKEIEEERKELEKQGVDPNASTGVGGFGMGDMGAMGGNEMMPQQGMPQQAEDPASASIPPDLDVTN